ncbi:MAG: sigma-54-dependent Fis family transcriptional regulator [Holophagaceae bacterium]|nr:sigma-54-dependent Fis family transcriptional regulator [Holophagaceae bacterium]
MMLQSAWLGHWKTPWPLTRGRKWGDLPWALFAISEAWLMGGRDNRWSRCAWEARRPFGPRPATTPNQWDPQPDPAWISLLRHGSSKIPAHLKGPKEDPLLTWCWSALLEGDGTPFMAYGSVLLDRPTRQRWIPLLGAVDESGRLELPPFLDILIPDAVKTLPQDWWPCLLRSIDAEGRLLPEGALGDVPFDRLRPFLEPFVLKELPDTLRDRIGTGWLLELTDGQWMIAPQVRAFARGKGPSTAHLPPSLALGDEPDGSFRELLDGDVRSKHPDGWTSIINADLSGSPRPSCPAPSNDPTWDRLRVRWGADLPETVAGYPSWGSRAHPCADPFHWMAEGRRAYFAQDLETALRAFTLAHAHFERLDSPFWSDRAAANAELAALHWADHQNLPFWQKAQAKPLSPFKELNEVNRLIVGGDWKTALNRLRALTEIFPEEPHAWVLIGQRGLETGRQDWIREALPHIADEGSKLLFEASLGEMIEPPPPFLHPEQRLLWEFHRLLRGHAESQDFWSAWEACPSHFLRLEAGLALLEARESERNPSVLLALQAIADRAAMSHHQDRLRLLWPSPALSMELDPRELLSRWLSTRTRPVWLVWGNPMETIGHGEPPPEGLLSRLHQDGQVAPCELRGWIWWGFPLHWEGSAVGSALLALKPGESLEPPLDPQLLAPWLAKLNPGIQAEPVPEGGELLTDGSEPMATLLRELARVAPSELPVLILGPTGTGKELTAREVHRRSGRPGPLVPVNCSAFSESLMESELFGHVRGAFTGAASDRKGAIESAQAGTLFLDEVADLSPRLQSLLLRVIQEHEVRKVGSDRSVRVDVRFVSATHRPLEELAAAGAFRRDLLYRLQGTALRLPSLRERSHEFPYLLPRLVSMIAKTSKRDAPELATGLAQSLAKLPWPGNVRELRHAIERALLRCGTGTLKMEHFPELQQPEYQSRSWEEATHGFQRRLLLETLRRCGFRATEAAETLGIARPALYTAAKRLDIDLVAERRNWNPEGA